MAARRLCRLGPIGFALILAACLSAPPRPSPSAAATRTATPRPAATLTTSPAAPPGPSAEERRQLQQQVIGLRGLNLITPFTETILSREGLRRRLAGSLFADAQRQAPDEVSLFSLLDLIDPATDLQALYRDLYSEQIVGTYDLEIGEMVLAAGPGWTGPERLRYVHQFTHALQDQAFQSSIGRRFSEETCRGAGDQCRALTALIEGDAALIEEQWLRTYATAQDFTDMAGEAAAETSPVLDSAPVAIRSDWRFARDHGLEYVRGLYLRDGWAAVDRAYLQPPQTTEEILHPAVSLRPPVIVDLGGPPQILGESWREVGRGVVGEWLTRLMLATRLEAAEAEAAAAGWGGDEYLILHNDGEEGDALVLVTVWDRAFDAYEFVTAMVQHAEARFGPTTGAADGASWTWQDGRIRLVRAYLQTLWVIAPSSAEAEGLIRSIRFPVST